MVGVLAGGFPSDSLPKEGKSVTVARRRPAIVGLVLSALSVTVNFFENPALMSAHIEDRRPPSVCGTEFDL